MHKYVTILVVIFFFKKTFNVLVLCTINRFCVQQLVYVLLFREKNILYRHFWEGVLDILYNLALIFEVTIPNKTHFKQYLFFLFIFLLNSLKTQELFLIII